MVLEHNVDKITYNSFSSIAEYAQFSLRCVCQNAEYKCFHTETEPVFFRPDAVFMNVQFR